MAAWCGHFEMVITRMSSRGLLPFPFAPIPSDLRVSSSVQQKMGEMYGHNSQRDVDGGVTDNNAIGETLRLMETVPVDQRPICLVSAITGMVTDNEDFYVAKVASYFFPEVKYGLAFFTAQKSIALKDRMDENPFSRALLKAGTQAMNCDLENLKVMNPHHFFTMYRKHFFQAKHSTGEVVNEHFCCEENNVQQTDNVRGCDTIASQAATTGRVLVEDIVVMPNSYFGITGMWTLDVLFSVLAKNDMSKNWVRDVYANYPDLKQSFSKFPIVAEGIGFNGFKDAKAAFALMQYHAYKGYFVICLLNLRYGNSQKYFGSQLLGIPTMCRMCENRDPGSRGNIYWEPAWSVRWGGSGTGSKAWERCEAEVSVSSRIEVYSEQR